MYSPLTIFSMFYFPELYISSYVFICVRIRVCICISVPEWEQHSIPTEMRFISTALYSSALSDGRQIGYISDLISTAIQLYNVYMFFFFNTVYRFITIRTSIIILKMPWFERHLIDIYKIYELLLTTLKLYGIYNN